jgi:hypothetical protein
MSKGYNSNSQSELPGPLNFKKPVVPNLNETMGMMVPGSKPGVYLGLLSPTARKAGDNSNILEGLNSDSQADSIKHINSMSKKDVLDSFTWNMID